MTNQEIIANAPDGWTHLDNFRTWWLNSKGKWRYLTRYNTWEESCYHDDPKPDPKSIRSRADIERIVELEQELKNQQVTLLEVMLTDKEKLKRDLEQQAKGVEDLKLWLHGHLSAVDLPDTAVIYIEEYADRLKNQAKELGK